MLFFFHHLQGVSSSESHLLLRFSEKNFQSPEGGTSSPKYCPEIQEKTERNLPSFFSAIKILKKNKIKKRMYSLEKAIFAYDYERAEEIITRRLAKRPLSWYDRLLTSLDDKKEFDINGSGRYDNKFFIQAVRQGDFQMAALLLRYGANINQTNDNTNTNALHYILGYSNSINLEMIVFLVFLGIDIHKISGNGATPLSMALDNGRFDIFRFLITLDIREIYPHGIMKTASKDIMKTDATKNASSRNSEKDIRKSTRYIDEKWLEEHTPSNHHLKERIPGAILREAAKRGCRSHVEFLLQEGYDIDGSIGISSSLLAERNGHLDISNLFNFSSDFDHVVVQAVEKGFLSILLKVTGYSLVVKDLLIISDKSKKSLEKTRMILGRSFRQTSPPDEETWKIFEFISSYRDDKGNTLAHLAVKKSRNPLLVLFLFTVFPRLFDLLDNNGFSPIHYLYEEWKKYYSPSEKISERTLERKIEISTHGKRLMEYPKMMLLILRQNSSKEIERGLSGNYLSWLPRDVIDLLGDYLIK